MAFVLLLFLPFLAYTDLQPEEPSGFIERNAVHGKTMMVASANPLASKVGYGVLQRGGNALDAAIAIQMMLNVAEPQSSGIGGGGLLLYYSKRDGKVTAYDGRETAPKGVSIGQLPEIIGGESVGTPGLLKMLDLVHKERGKLEWRELFEPAIEWAQRGIDISDRLHQLIKKTSGLDTFNETKAFFFERGEARGVGTVLKNPELAKTLRLIADEGVTPFYEGEIGQDIVQAVQMAKVRPGKLTLLDLENYRAIKREPIQTSYRGYTVYGFPPPSAGGIAVGQILGMLQDVNVEGMELGSADFIDLFCKASRAAYADMQCYVGDPAFTNVPVKHLLKSIYLAHRLSSPGKCAISAIEHPSTTQICVVDGEGNAVSLTSSIEYAFGSSIMVRGFLLNNQMTDFSSGPNKVEGGKRPKSSMSPTLIFDEDRLVLNVGSAGGPRIIDYVAQVIFGVLDFGLNVQEAISFPNFASVKRAVDLEEGTFLENEKEVLESKGNRVKVMPLTSGTQAIELNAEGLIGGVDPRREGLAIGD